MSKTFVKISNEEIFRKIQNIETKLDTDIALRIAKMDKRITIAIWTSTTALSICLIMIGVLLKV